MTDKISFKLFRHLCLIGLGWLLIQGCEKTANNQNTDWEVMKEKTPSAVLAVRSMCPGTQSVLRGAEQLFAQASNTA